MHVFVHLCVKSEFLLIFVIESKFILNSILKQLSILNEDDRMNFLPKDCIMHFFIFIFRRELVNDIDQKDYHIGVENKLYHFNC